MIPALASSAACSDAAASPYSHARSATLTSSPGCTDRPEQRLKGCVLTFVACTIRLGADPEVSWLLQTAYPSILNLRAYSAGFRVIFGSRDVVRFGSPPFGDSCSSFRTAPS